MSSPPFAVPPLSCRNTVTVALPFAFAAACTSACRPPATAGCAENSALLSFDTTNVSVWPPSLAGPVLIAVAQLAIDCAPASSKHRLFGPSTKWTSLTGGR